MKRSTQFRAAGLLLLLSTPVLANVEVSTVAEIEHVETAANGETVVKRVPAERVVPGTEVIFTINARNTGHEPAEHIVVTNELPEHTVYVEGSAAGDNVDIRFSVDGGDHYDRPENLRVPDASGELRPATAEDYTHLRWTLRENLKPEQQVPVWYRAQVK